MPLRQADAAVHLAFMIMRAASRETIQRINVDGTLNAPPFAGWAEAVSHPAIMDTTKAKRELSCCPRFSSLEALRATLKAGQ